MPDDEYYKYVASRVVCAEHKFKGLSEAFGYAAAKQYRFIDLTKTPTDVVKRNWELLKEQNVRKANWLVTDRLSMPAEKSVISQMSIFKAQRLKFVEANDSVSILNSFPIFVYDYLR